MVNTVAAAIATPVIAGLIALLGCFVAWRQHWAGLRYELKLGPSADFVLANVEGDKAFTKPKIRKSIFRAFLTTEISIECPRFDEDQLEHLTNRNKTATGFKRSFNASENPYPVQLGSVKMEMINTLHRTELVERIRAGKKEKFEAVSCSAYPFAMVANIKSDSWERRPLHTCKIRGGRYYVPFNAAAYYRQTLRVAGEFQATHDGGLRSWAPWGVIDFRRVDGDLLVHFTTHGNYEQAALGMMACRELRMLTFGGRDWYFTSAIFFEPGQCEGYATLTLAKNCHNALLRLVKRALLRLLSLDEVKELMRSAEFFYEPSEPEFITQMLRSTASLAPWQGFQDFPRVVQMPAHLQSLEPYRLDSSDVERWIEPSLEGRRTDMTATLDQVKQILANIKHVSKAFIMVPELVYELGIPDERNAWMG